MNADFPRILTLLRKEKGISQKEAAAKLGISQALLSHYEKGIRECGLDFLVRCADFYSVSADYLLGRSPERSGSTIKLADLPEADALGKENTFQGSVLPVLNKKLIANSLNILFDLLGRCHSDELVNEVSDFLMLSYYRMFRLVYKANPKNHLDLFMVSDPMSANYSTAAMQLCEAQAAFRAGAVEAPPAISTESLSSEYPLFATSLMNLIRNSEKTIAARCTTQK